MKNSLFRKAWPPACGSLSSRGVHPNTHLKRAHLEHRHGKYRKVSSNKNHTTHNLTVCTTMSAVVHIFPRRKAGESACPEKGRAPLKFDLASIQPLFALSQKDAARALGISLTALKKMSRKLGINSWVQVRDVHASASPHAAPTPRSSHPVSRGGSYTSADSSAEPRAQELEAPSIYAEARLCAKAQAPVDISGFLGALDFENEAATTSPEALDSDFNTALRDSDEASDSTDTDSDAPILQSKDILVDPESGQELGHSAPTDDLAFLVLLPSGPCLESNAPVCSREWLEWYMKRQHGVSRWPR